MAAIGFASVKERATIDEGLLLRLPLPLARLYRRAHNAKTPCDRCLAAYYLWEASLKLLASVAVVEYVELDDDDAKLHEMLKRLARPMLGNYWEFVRRLVPVLAQSGDQPFSQLRDLLLGRSRDDLPRAAALYEALLRGPDDKPRPRSTVRLTELFDRMVKFRSDYIGHGAVGQQSDSFYERMGRLLLAGVAELLDRLDPLAGRRLLYIDDVRRLGDGSWLVERYELRAESARRIPSLELPEETGAENLPRPHRIYLARETPVEAVTGECTSFAHRQLHPLLSFKSESEEVFFLNARRKARQAEYLCYGTGRVLKGVELATDHRELLARALDQPINDSAVDRWAAESLAEDPPVAEQPSDSVPRSIGEFELLSRIGRGGMGVVYRAWQPSLGRQVALKCLLRTGDRKSEARFAREIRALGQVDHPHLVKIYTSGVADDQWFYAMEVIEGADLSGVCQLLAGTSASEVDIPQWQKAVSTAAEVARSREESLDTQDPGCTTDFQVRRIEHSDGLGSPSYGSAPTDRTLRTSRGHITHVVEIIRQVSQAAHALHSQSIIHRDIKPGNVMLTADGSHAVLMDLGLAQLADQAEGRLTRTRQFVGTLRYASPEQVLAVDRMDARSDVYSLGATLWEMLTLRPLFDATDETPSPEIMQKIQVTDPQPPSRHNPHVPRDLDAIVLRCLEKDTARRYGSADELNEDFNRFLKGDSVEARAVGQFERAWRWTRRNSRVAALLLLIALSLIGGTITSVIFALEADQQASQATQLKEKAEAERDRADQEAKEALAQKKNAEKAKKDARIELGNSYWQRAVMARDYEHHPVKSSLLFANSAKAFEAAERFGQAISSLIANTTPVISTFKHDTVVRGALFSPDQSLVLTWSDDGTARLWDPQRKQPVRTFEHHGSVFGPVLNGDGSRVLTFGIGGAHLWDVDQGQPIKTFKHDDLVYGALFNGDESRVLTWSDGGIGDTGTVRLWDLERDRPIKTFKHDAWVNGALFSKDEARVLTWSSDRTARIWDLAQNEPIRAFKHYGITKGPLFNKDESRVLTWSAETARIWDLDEVHPIKTFKHDAYVNGALFSKDEARVLAWSRDDTARLWDVHQDQPIKTFEHDAYVNGALFNGDESRVLTWSDDGTARLWDVDQDQPIMTFKHDDEVHGALFSVDESRVLTWSRDNTARLWDVDQNQPIKKFEHDYGFESALFNGDESRVLTWSGDGTARLWDIDHDQPIKTFMRDESLYGVERELFSIGVLFSADSRALTWSDDGTARVWDIDHDQPIKTFEHDSVIKGALFSGDESRVLTWSDDGRVGLWDVDHAQPIRTFKHDDEVNGALFNGDESRVLTWSKKMACLWDVDHDQPIRTFKHRYEVNGALFSSDESRVLTWGVERIVVAGTARRLVRAGTARLWDVDQDQPIKSFEHDSNILGALFNGDESRVLTWSDDGAVRLWDVDRDQLFKTFQHDDIVNGALFNGDESRVLTWSSDGTVRLWDLMQDQPIKTFKHDDAVLGALFSSDESRVLTWTGARPHFDAERSWQELLEETSGPPTAWLWDVSDYTGRAVEEVILELEVRLAATIDEKNGAYRLLSFGEWEDKRKELQEFRKTKSRDAKSADEKLVRPSVATDDERQLR